MRFDYTKGKSAGYMVGVYRATVDDHYYFHYYKEAKKLFEDIKANSNETVTVSIWDMKRDTRKDYAKVEVSL